MPKIRLSVWLTWVMNKPFPSLNILRKNIAEQLEKAGIDHSFDEAKWLILGALNADPGLFILNQDDQLTDDLINKINAFVARRLKREPLSRIQGVREFWSLPFHLNEATLDPRPDSEIIVESGLRYIAKEEHKTLLDLGTGSGCLLISLLHERPNCQGIGVDVSPRAAIQARENAVLNEVGNTSLFLVSSWGEALVPASFDFIISNPPYIPLSEKHTLSPEVSQYDPDLALYGGDDGLECYRILAPEMRRLVKPDGVCLLEIGHQQGNQVQEIFEGEKFTLVSLEKDLEDRDRVLVFRKN